MKRILGLVALTIIAGSSLLVAMEDKVFVLESIKNDYSQPISIRVTEGASSTGSQQRHVIAPGDTFYFYQKVPIYRGKVFLDIPGGQLTDEYEMLSYGSSLHLQAEARNCYVRTMNLGKEYPLPGTYSILVQSNGLIAIS